MSEAVQKQIKLYLIIGLALFVGTILTVWVADLKVAIVTGIIIAVVIATIKSTLVAGLLHALVSRGETDLSSAFPDRGIHRRHDRLGDVRRLRPTRRASRHL